MKIFRALVLREKMTKGFFILFLFFFLRCPIIFTSSVDKTKFSCGKPHKPCNPV